MYYLWADCSIMRNIIVQILVNGFIKRLVLEECREEDVLNKKIG